MGYNTDWHAEDHSRCQPRALRQYWQGGHTQSIDLNSVVTVLRHKRDHMRQAENHVMFDGERYSSVRCLQPHTVSSHMRDDGWCDGSGYRSTHWHPHEEFVGQGWWRGPYPYSN